MAAGAVEEVVVNEDVVSSGKTPVYVYADKKKKKSKDKDEKEPEVNAS